VSTVIVIPTSLSPVAKGPKFVTSPIERERIIIRITVDWLSVWKIYKFDSCEFNSRR